MTIEDHRTRPKVDGDFVASLPKSKSGAERFVLGKYPEPVLIPTERYISREFLRLEFDEFWPKVWQFACREEEVANVGDFVEYKIGYRSVLIVRSAPDEIKGFHNACLHRGRLLKEGCGSAQELRCGFHAWRWYLDGTIKEVVDADTFHPESIRPDDLQLPEVLVGTWGGFVFINFDHDAEPLRDFLADLPALFDDTWPDKLHLSSVRTIALDSNWKVGIEAFIEGYHIIGTHEQSLWTSDDSLWKYGRSLITGRHASLASESPGTDDPLLKSRPEHTSRPCSPRLGEDVAVDESTSLETSVRALWNVRGLMTAHEDMAIAEEISRTTLPEGVSTWEYYHSKIIESFEAEGIEVPPKSNGPFMGMFPNTQFLYFTGPRVMQVYRFRPHPTDPDKCYFDMMFLRRYPKGHIPKVVREVHDPALTGDDQRDVDEFGLALMQDLRNIPYVQKGLHSLIKSGVRPGQRQEQALRHLHEGIDEYLNTRSDRR